MKQLIICAAMALVAASCGNDSEPALKDPSSTHPPSEAIPDTLQIVQDSNIVVDPKGDAGAEGRVGASDSIHQHQ